MIPDSFCSFSNQSHFEQAAAAADAGGQTGTAKEKTNGAVRTEANERNEGIR